MLHVYTCSLTQKFDSGVKVTPMYVDVFRKSTQQGKTPFIHLLHRLYTVHGHCGTSLPLYDCMYFTV